MGDSLAKELFFYHDLNGNGVLEMSELVKLNEKIAILHGSGQDANTIRRQYQDLFKRKLNPDGHAVPFSVFERYIRELLQSLDPDPRAQEMILEQWVAEASSTRHIPTS